MADKDNENIESMDDLDKMFEEADAVDGLGGSDDSGDRDPITDVKDIGKMAAKNLTDPGKVLTSVSEAVSESLPSPIRNEVDKAKEIHDQVLQPLAKGLKRARNTASGLTSTLADVLPEVPGVNSTLRKISNALKPEEENDTGFSSEEENEDETIKNNVNEVFGESRPEDRVKERLDNIQKLSDLELTVRNVKNMEVIKDYFLHDHYNFIRKSLELQFKQTITMVDLRNRFVVFSKEHMELLKAITKNTGLPDTVKMQNKEMIADALKKKAFSSGINLLTNSKYIEKLKNNITDAILDKVENYASMVDMGTDTLNMGKELMEQLPPAERREAIAEQLSEMAIGTLTNTVFDKVKESKLGNKVLGTAGKTIQKTLRDPTKLLDKIMPSKVKENGLYADFKDILKYSKEESGVGSLRLEENDLSAPAIFDFEVKKSITAVIPGLLSKILNSIDGLRTGKFNKDNELVFDYNKNKFVNKSTIKKELISELNENKNNFTDTTKYASENILSYLLGNNYTDKDVMEFKKGLENLILNGGSIDVYDWYDNPDILKGFDSKVRSKIQKGIKKLVESKDIDSMRIINRIEDTVRRARSYTSFMSDKLDFIKDYGLADTAEELGLVDKDTNTINSDKVKEILTKGINVKPIKTKTTKTKQSNKSVKSNLTSNCDVCEYLKSLPIISNTIKGISNIINKVSNIASDKINVSRENTKQLTNIVRLLSSRLTKRSKLVNTPIAEPKPVRFTNIPLNHTYTINNAVMNISNATINGLNATVNNVLDNMSKSITKIIDTNIGDKLVTKLNKTYESITSKTLDDYKNLITSKFNNTKDFITDTKLYKSANDKLTEFKQSDTYKNIQSTIDSNIKNIKQSDIYKSTIDIKKNLEKKFKEQLIPIEETNDKGEKETSYLLELGKYTLVLPAAALTSPIALAKAVKDQVPLKDVPFILKELLPSKKTIQTTLSNVKDQSVTKLNELTNNIKQSDIYKNTTKEINTKIANIKQSDTYKETTKEINKQINKIKSSNIYKEASKKLSSTKSSLENYIRNKFKDNIVEVNDVDENGNPTKAYLLSIGKYTLALPAEALSSPKLLIEAIRSQVSKEDFNNIVKELLPSKQDIINKLTNTKNNLTNLYTDTKKSIDEKGILGYLKDEKDKAVKFIDKKKNEKEIQDVLSKIKLPDSIKNIDIYDKLPDSIKQVVTKDEDGNYVVTVNDSIFKVDTKGLTKLLPTLTDMIEKGAIDLGKGVGNGISYIKDKVQKEGVAGALVDVAKDVRKSLTNILKEHKDVPVELLKQMFGGKNPFKDKVSVTDIIKAFTFGTFKSSFWFGRNVIRPGYKKMLAGIGNIAHKAAVTTLTTAFGFSPGVAESVVGMMEAPFKLVGSALNGVNTVFKKTKDAFKGLFNIVGKMGKLFLSKTWGLVKKGLGFLTGKSEEEIDESTNALKNKVTTGANSAKNKWMDLENKNLLTKTLMSPLRIGASLPGNLLKGTVKGAKALANTFVITDEEEKNLWLNKKLEENKGLAGRLKNSITDKLSSFIPSSVNKNTVNKYVDENGRTVIEAKLNKPSETKPKQLTKATDIIKNTNTKSTVDKVNEKTKPDKSKETNDKKTIDREKKIEQLRDSLDKDKEDKSLPTKKGSVSNSTVSILGLLGAALPVIVNAFKNIDKWLPKLWQGVKDAAKWIGKELWEGTKALAKWLPGAIWKGTKWIGGELWKGTKWLGSEIWKGIKNLGKWLLGLPKKIVVGIADGIKNVGKWIGNSILNILKHILPGNLLKGAKELYDKASKTYHAAKEKVIKITDDVKKAAGRVVDKVKSTAKNVYNNVKDKVKSTYKTITNFFWGDDSDDKPKPKKRMTVNEIIKHKWSNKDEMYEQLEKTSYVKNLIGIVKTMIPKLKDRLIKLYGKDKANHMLADKIKNDELPALAAHVGYDVLTKHTNVAEALSNELVGTNVFSKEADKLIKQREAANKPATNTKAIHLDKTTHNVNKKPTPVVVHNTIDNKHNELLTKSQEMLLEINSKQLDIQNEINENLKTLTEIFTKKIKTSNSRRVNLHNVNKTVVSTPQPAVSAYSDHI